VSANDLEFIDRLWADWSPGHDATVDMSHIRASIGSRENLAAALGYYRATWGIEPVSSAYQDIQNVLGTSPPQPTLYIHGRNDGCVGVEFAENVAAELSAGSQSVIIEGAGHFTQVEKPEEFNRLVLDFIQF
jgi:hypothetical protein